MNDSQHATIALLVEKIAHDEATENEIITLEAILLESSDARKLYHQLMRQHAHLKHSCAAGAISPIGSMPRNTWWNSNLTKLGIAAAIVIGVTWISLLSWNPASPSSSNLAIATLTESSAAQWGECDLPTSKGSLLEKGSLELLQGWACLKLTSGVKINLEAPVKIELRDNMHAYIHYGTAIADVPDQAQGFRMDAPDAEVTDYGTVFAVSVDKKGVSSVNVLDGEVEVFHHQSKERMRLTQNDPLKNEIRTKDNIGTNTLIHKVLSISSGSGGYATVMPKHADTHTFDNLIMLKNPVPTSFDYSRKAYLKFDISDIDTSSIAQADLLLDQVVSNIGFSTRIPDCTFSVYVLKHESEWSPSSTNWQNAPANIEKSSTALQSEKVINVGEFVIPKGQQMKTITTSLKLAKLDLSNRSQLSLIIVRDTMETNASGLVHTFAGVDHPAGEAPRLVLQDK